MESAVRDMRMTHVGFHSKMEAACGPDPYQGYQGTHGVQPTCWEILGVLLKDYQMDVHHDLKTDYHVWSGILGF